ncbi:MAG TPA: hypothetical protein VMW04_00195 [Patescibacteria group bacterium]|nr:hypothetical protein [Patescibacteria group bacterium]
MARKDFLGYFLAFMAAMLVMAGVICAQSPTPTTKGGVTPTPTPMPGAPSTGLGGGR